MREILYSEYNAWLQNAKKDFLPEKTSKILESVYLACGGEVAENAQNEFVLGLKKRFCLESKIIGSIQKNCTVLCTVENLPNEIKSKSLPKKAEGFSVFEDDGKIIICGFDSNGLLYGVYELLETLSLNPLTEEISLLEEPVFKLRMINHWDNMDGSIERGYAGKSIFYDQNKFSYDENRIKDYARLLASTKINCLSINNVNVHKAETKLIAKECLPEVAKLASIFRPFGIKILITVNFAAPVVLGKLSSADPLDPSVIKWWENKCDEIYEFIPDLAGFLVKADSESEPGPFDYGRTHAEGANMLARALKSHGGVVLWRCFVYNCKQDWRDTSQDRPKAAYEHFMPLDGKFDENVLLQIKNGPYDFQVIEPVSPLLGAMKNTNQAIELQITQEYTGQQKDLCYLIPMWKKVFDFDTKLSENSRISDFCGNRISGIAGVGNVGLDVNWTGHTLAQANFYGYGKLAWNPNTSEETITENWTRLTFGNDKEVVDKIKKLLSGSYETYKKYTTPLGIGWMIDPPDHYGPNVEGFEYSRWGTYNRADFRAIGIDRTPSGTGMTEQYSPENAAIFRNPETCPEELLLFFHRLPYTYMLKSGKTLIQHVYDTHFEGFDEVLEMIKLWDSLKGKIDDSVFKSVSKRLSMQLKNAREWRDVINTYFYRRTGIPDEKGRKIYP